MELKSKNHFQDNFGQLEVAVKAISNSAKMCVTKMLSFCVIAHESVHQFLIEAVVLENMVHI